MAHRSKSSAQRSRSPSQSEEEVIESNEELPSSEQEEDHVAQVAQINLLCHQRTELPQHRYKKKKSHAKPRQGHNTS